MPNLLTKTLARAFNRVAYGEIDPYQPMRNPTGLGVSGSWWASGSFDTSRVNYDRARRLYRNTLPQYKLGAHFARPIINFTAGFMGVPTFTHQGDNEAADAALADFDRKFVTKFLTVNRNMLRDGDVYVRLEFIKNRFGIGSQFDVTLLHPEWCEPVHNPVTGEWDSFIITHPVYPQDNRLSTSQPRDRNVQMSYAITETITPETITFLADEKAPQDIRDRFNGVPTENPWKFIPVVAFLNEPETGQVYGASDLEPLEPLFRTYHDTMLVGAQGIKLFAKPKVKFNLKSVQRFLGDNFPDWKPGQAVNFQGRELFLLEEGEDASYITADPGTAGVGTLLEFIFYCIVQSSQVPEFVLGAGVQSSRASVETQLGPFVKTIERKRMMAQDPYAELHQMFLAAALKTPSLKIGTLETLEVIPNWPEITPTDEQAVANTIGALVTAFQAGTASGLVPIQAAHDFLQPYIPTMREWTGRDGDQARIQQGLAWLERIQMGGLPDPNADPNANPGLPQIQLAA